MKSYTKPTRSPRSISAQVFGLFVGKVWQYRIEIGAIALLLIALSWLSRIIGSFACHIVLVVLLVLLAFVPKPRDAVFALFERLSIKRSVDLAFANIGIPRLENRKPTVVGISSTGAGWRISLSLRVGTDSFDIDTVAPRLAVALKVKEVRVHPSSQRANLVDIVLLVSDPLSSATPFWPEGKAPSSDFEAPVPVGIDEIGGVVKLRLTERNLLLGGEPGAGKSSVLQLLVAKAALDPSVQLYLFDGKQVELKCWSAVAKSFCGLDLEKANSILEELRIEMDSRYLVLTSAGRRKIKEDPTMRPIVIAIDELALYTASPDKKGSQRFSELLRDIVARGRAAGIVVLAATQKPSVEVVPSSLRDLFSYRWALRCTTKDASDTVLGAGWASEGFSAAGVDPSLRGVGLLLHEGAMPIRLRSFYLNDAQIQDLISRSAERRREIRG